MEVVSPGVNGHAPSSNSVTTIDPNVVLQHLVDLLEVTIGASAEDLERPGSLLSTYKRHDTVQRCTRFASESQVAIYVQKDVVLTDAVNGDPHGSSGQQQLSGKWGLHTDLWFRKYASICLLVIV